MRLSIKTVPCTSKPGYTYLCTVKFSTEEFLNELDSNGTQPRWFLKEEFWLGFKLMCHSFNAWPGQLDMDGEISTMTYYTNDGGEEDGVYDFYFDEDGEYYCVPIAESQSV